MYYLCILALLGIPLLGSAGGVENEFSDAYAETSLIRSKRRASCEKWKEWQCRDGSCISPESKCDGAYDCPDKSDETHALCRNKICQPNWFRCTYGACVDGTAPCNGVQDCADNSDELLPRCRNQTTLFSREVPCDDGEIIPATSRCDGVVDCNDRSDETPATCADAYCPDYYFRCAYGACVDRGADCDGKNDCADGSDEDNVLCNITVPMESRIMVKEPNLIDNSQHTTVDPNSYKKCKLPSYPEHGSYVGDGFLASPGDDLSNGQINFTCSEGYKMIGERNVFCFYGKWLDEFPKCAKFCKLEPKVNMEFQCVLTGDSKGTRKCEEYEPVGTQVAHQCGLNYRSEEYDLGYMVCKEEGWVNVPRCLPDCGKVTPVGTQLIMGGQSAVRGELPWHTGIYSKVQSDNIMRYKQICGGSLISRTVVLSAAHCFWDGDQPLPAEKYAAAVGKLYRKWRETLDDAQRSDVKELYISEFFMGVENQYQGDIALLVLATAVTYKSHIRPVCISFSRELAKAQLHIGNSGKIAGWGLTASNGTASRELKVVEIPYVDPGVCKEKSVKEFKPFITADKFCAGYDNGTALCRGDSGGGLVFRKRGTERYYLRGIVSTAHHTNDACNSKSLTTFTNLVLYEDFIKEHWSADDF
ncbi:modular serine protease isoform X2 [Manduca sexta]|uniref:modular serine protease isoform X2 n=1 Tax=Manduca sexta TaxID=7130 RepID=UPI00188E7D6F|nr:modular serine protease isoform X2 [Manduca sexta]